MTQDMLVIELKRLRRMVAMLALGMLAMIVLGAGDSESDERVLTVERINVVEPDGTLALVIGSAQRLPNAIVGGEEIAESRSAAGMLFFNHKGDECGGLIYRTLELEDGRVVGYVHLSMDQCEQNQVVKLATTQNIRGVTSGLTVIDRPTDMTLAEVFDLQRRAGTNADARAEFEALDAAGRIGADRVFVGSRDRDASVDLKDAVGRTRLRFVVGAQGAARIEFLSATGEVVKTVDAEGA